MVTNPYDDAATLAMLKHINPDADRIWRAWDDLGARRTRNGAGAVRLLDAPDGAGTMSATPGKWIAKPRSIGGYTIFATDDVFMDIAICIVPLNDHPMEMVRDTAHLIAAAPGLRSAAINAVASSHKLQDGQHDTPEGFVLISEAALADLVAAILKTEDQT